MAGANDRVETVARHRSGPRRPDLRRPGLPLARIALLLAALVALVAVGVAIRRGRQGDAPLAAAPAGTPPAAAPQAAAPQADVATMIAQLEARLKADPGDAAGWRMLGWSYYRTERFADAASAYRRATVTAPGNAEGWSALGEALSLAGNGDVPAEAEGAFRKALAIDPADPRARYFLAVRKDLSGDHRGAVDDWIALLKDTPAGAPWEQNVRETIAQVAAKNRVDIAGRVPAPGAAAAAAGPAGADAAGADAATAAIPGPTREQMAAASAIPPGQQDAMVRGMVDSLAARLRASPRDADGWLRLMRARMVLNDRAAATQALRDGTAAFPADKAAQGRLAEGARALGVPGA